MKSLLILLACCAALASAATQFRLPVVLPPFGLDKSDAKIGSPDEKWGTCLFYMENLGVTVLQPKKQPNGWSAVISARPPEDHKDTPHEFAWDTSYVKCPKTWVPTAANAKNFTAQNFTIVVDVTTKFDVQAKNKDKSFFKLNSGSQFKFTLTFETVSGYGFHLVDVATDGFKVSKDGDWLGNDLTVEKGSATKMSIAAMQVGAFNNYNYGCSATKLAVFNVSGSGDDKSATMVGVYFGNMQFQAFNYTMDKDKKAIHFSPNTADCVGTFTHGSFMGIIVSLVLASILIMGFLMLNSVQTVDRFDDPKQKQLLINAKE